MENKIRFGIPKGSLEKATLELFRKAGYPISGSERSYRLQCSVPGLEFILLRPQEIPSAVARSTLDAGITGMDWVLDSNVETIPVLKDKNGVTSLSGACRNGETVAEVTKLQYSKSTLGNVSWVLAVPFESCIKKASDLNGLVVSTELVNVTTKFLERNGVTANVKFSWGATEAKPALGLADAIVDLVETGASLKSNGLRIVAAVIESYTTLIANVVSYTNPVKKQKIDDISTLLRSALDARNKVGIKMNSMKKDIGKILQVLLPNGVYGANSPTISDLANPGWVALEVIVDEERIQGLIPELKRSGASGIIEYPLNKIVM